jgi:hypothetical protein
MTDIDIESEYGECKHSLELGTCTTCKLGIIPKYGKVFAAKFAQHRIVCKKEWDVGDFICQSLESGFYKHKECRT